VPVNPRKRKNVLLTDRLEGGLDVQGEVQKFEIPEIFFLENVSGVKRHHIVKSKSNTEQNVIYRQFLFTFCPFTYNSSRGQSFCTHFRKTDVPVYFLSTTRLFGDIFLSGPDSISFSGDRFSKISSTTTVWCSLHNSDRKWETFSIRLQHYGLL
jgi:hypothetical protein